MVQSNSSRDQITARLGRSQFHVVITFKRFDRFSFNQRQFEVGFRLEESSLAQGVAVALESHSGDGEDFVHGKRGGGRLRGDVDEFDGACAHTSSLAMRDADARVREIASVEKNGCHFPEANLVGMISPAAFGEVNPRTKINSGGRGRPPYA